MIRSLLLISSIAACATADPPGQFAGGADAGGGSPIDAAGGQSDAPSRPIDAAGSGSSAPMDAPAGPTTITLTQVSTTVLATSSLGCEDDNTDSTYEQAYYRVFDLAAMGVTSTLTLSSVAFGVQSADGTETLTINVGTYSAAPGTTLSVGSADWGAGDVTAIATTTTSLPASSTGTIVSVPIAATIPSGSRLIVEVRSPNESSKNDVALFLGASSGTETTPGFYWSTECGAVPPGTPSELGQDTVPFLITATGTY